MEGDAERFYLGLEHVGHGKHRLVTAGTHLKGEPDQRIDIAEGAEGGENNPHAVGPVSL
jgi:hypothetical protein